MIRSEYSANQALANAPKFYRKAQHKAKGFVVPVFPVLGYVLALLFVWQYI